MSDYLKELENKVDQDIDQLVENIKKFVKDNKVEKFYLGMSGGIDCAVVAALCKRAEVDVVCVTMPYRAESSKTRKRGMIHAAKQCRKLDIPLYTVDISDMEALIVSGCSANVYKGGFLVKNHSQLAKANILPRLRMTVLYYIAQCNNGMVLGTGNLSEMVMGYFTKWGDGAYDFNPLSTITKTEVKMMAEKLNIIPEIINKKPSADLWDGQTDEDEIGLSYNDIDRYILTGHHDDKKVVEKIKGAICRNKHKFVGKTEVVEILKKLQ